MVKQSLYVSKAQNYLKSYNGMKVFLHNVDDEIAALRDELDNVSIPIGHYGVEAGGGTNELTQPEREASRREKLERRIGDLLQRKRDTERIIRCIDRALGGLADDERTILQERFMEGYRWVKIAMGHYCSERSAQQKAKAAVKQVAFMLFGPMDEIDSLLFQWK